MRKPQRERLVDHIKIQSVHENKWKVGQQAERHMIPYMTKNTDIIDKRIRNIPIANRQGYLKDNSQRTIRGQQTFKW